MTFSRILTIVLSLSSLALPACNMREEKTHQVVATSPEVKSVTITQQYVCQIHAYRHMKVRAQERGYLEAIAVKEGQKVEQGDVMFKVLPTHYQAKLDAEKAEVQTAQLKLDNAKKRYDEKVATQNEVALLGAKLAKAQAQLAVAESNVSTVKASFDGIVGRLLHQQGSAVEQGEVVTTLSDNSFLWVYFNIPETRYLQYMAELNQQKEELQIELVLANGKKFEQIGKVGAIEAHFNHKTGSIQFRADFPNPERLVRHGQTGNVLIHRVVDDAIVIPQRATFENLHKRYVYVINKENVVRQREIVIQNELEDIYVIKSGIGVDDKIVLDGIQQLRDGDKVVYDNRQPGQVIANQKHVAK